MKRSHRVADLPDLESMLRKIIDDTDNPTAALIFALYFQRGATRYILYDNWSSRDESVRDDFASWVSRHGEPTRSRVLNWAHATAMESDIAAPLAFPGMGFEITI